MVEQQNAFPRLWEGIRVYSGLLFVQRALLGDGLGVGQNQQATDDDSLQSWQGRDIYGALVHVPLPAGDHTGRLVNARIVEAKKHSLVAEATGQPW